MKRDKHKSEAHWVQRLLWLIAIWGISVLLLGLLTIGLRFFMRLAGLTT